MTQMIQTIVSGASDILTTAMLAATTLIAVGFQPEPQSKSKSKPTRLNAHMLSDIGVEPGSITWR